MKMRYIIYLAMGVVFFAGLTTCTLFEDDVAADDTVDAPVIELPSGIYGTAQTVTITSGTAGATVKYTTDDTDPLTSTTSSIGEAGSGTAAVAIDSSLTLKTYAYLSGMVDSAVSSATYIITSSAAETVEAPVIDIPSSTYASTQTVTITSGTAGATVKYTTDDTDPLTSTSFSIGAVGSGTAAVTVDSTCTLKAYAYLSGMVDSPVSSATYIITSAPTVTCDYTVSSAAYPASVVPAAVFEGTFKISNIGLAGAEDITWTVYYSADADYDAGDTVIETGTLSALGVGDLSSNITFSGTWPVVSTGFYSIIILSAADDLETGNDTVVSGLIPLSASGRFVALGEGGTVIYSDDGGASWIASVDTDLTGTIFSGIARSENTGRLVAVGDDGVNGKALYSEDGGENWIPSTISSSEVLNEICWGNDSTNSGTFVAVANTKIFWTADPTGSWNTATTTVRNYRDVAFGEDTFVASGNTVDNFDYSTNGGANWTANNSGMGSSLYANYTIEYAGSRFVAFGIYSGTITGFYHSEDGSSTWTYGTPSGSTSNVMRAMAYDGTTFVLAAGDTGEMWYSSNAGENWAATNGTVQPDSDLYGAAYGDGVWIVTGTVATGNIWRTTNLAGDWTAVTLGANTIIDVVYLP